MIQNYTVEELDRPSGYLATYSSETRVEEDWAAQVTLTFTPKDKQSDKILQITCKYNGVEYTYTTPKGTYNNNQSYSFVVDNLPLDENGNPYSSCEFVKVVVNPGEKDEKQIDLKADMPASASAEKYLRGSVNTEVKVITNAPAYELPSMGGTGTILHTAGGLLLAISSALLLMYNHIKRKKEDLDSP